MTDPKPLCACGRVSRHQTAYPGQADWTYQCCFCHYESGHAPADWHLDCMEAVRLGKQILTGADQ